MDADVDSTDPRLKQLLGLLKYYGFDLKPESLKELSDQDRLRYVRWRSLFVSDESDWDAAPYLLLEPIQKFAYGDMVRQELTGPLNVGCHEGVPRWWYHFDFATLNDNGQASVISDHVKRTLESASMRRIQFRPVEVHEYYRKMNPPTLWELESELVMPAIAPTVPMVDMRGNAIAHDDPSTLWRTPKPSDGMWAYTRSAIESVGAFDIARTLEPWFGPNRPSPRNGFIVSQKFYRVCRGSKFNVSWIPVRIEDD